LPLSPRLLTGEWEVVEIASVRIATAAAAAAAATATTTTTITITIAITPHLPIFPTIAPFLLVVRTAPAIKRKRLHHHHLFTIWSLRTRR
jgi:hypothetical protein